MAVFFSALGLIMCFAILIMAAWKKINMFLVAVIGACIVAAAGGLHVIDALENQYMTGFVSFVQNWIIVLALGALLGALYSESGAAWRIGDTLIRKAGASFALVVYIFVGAILVYCGITVPVTVFVLLPLARTIFPKAGIPWHLFPGITGLGIATFAMYAPGSLQVVNLIPARILDVPTTAAPFEGIAASLFLLIAGMIYLRWEIRRAGGIKEGDLPSDYLGSGKIDNEDEMNERAPSFLISIIPIILTLIMVNILGLHMIIGFGTGCAVSLILFWKNIPDKASCVSDGFKDGIVPCILVSAVVGLGSVISATPVFAVIKNSIMKLPLNGLAKVAVVTTVIAGACASGAGGLQLSLELFGNTFLSWGFPATVVARVAAIACGGLDSMPWNGSVVMLFTLSCVGYNKGYKSVAVLTVLLPILASFVAVLAYTLRMAVM